ncbi:MAG: M56 family metallopeptidase [Kangiellaceae bacterium]
MSLFDTYLNDLFGVTPTLFEFFLINSFYAFVLGLVVISLKLVYPKLSKNTEYFLWCIVLIRLVLPNNFSFEYSVGEFIQSSFSENLALSFSSSDWLYKVLVDNWLGTYVTDFTNSNLSSLIMPLWLVVLSVSLFRFTQLKIKLQKLLKRTQPVGEYRIVKEVNRWRREFSIQRQVIVLKSDDFISPFTFGVFTPVIFIPKQLIESDQVDVNQTLETVIAHELMHVKRLDALWLNFQNLVQIVYCINPIVWFIVWRLNSLREEVCDQQVLNSQKISKESYGKSLLQVLRFSIGSKSPELFATFFLSHKSVFKKRIKAIANSKISRNSSLKIRSIKLVLLSLFAFMMLPLGWQHRPIVLPDLSEKLLEQELSPFPEEVRKTYKAPVVKPKR